MTGFKATVCASTGDNLHNCAPTRWGSKVIVAVNFVAVIQCAFTAGECNYVNYI